MNLTGDKKMEHLQDIQSMNWAVDKAHSKIGFTARHMVISQVHGQFDSFNVTAESNGENFEDSKVQVEIDVASINTGIADRDNHLRSADFFDVEKYPKIYFKSKSLKVVDEEDFKLIGDLTIKDITKEVELDVEFGGQVVDPWGNNRVGFRISGKVDRFDFDLKWNNLIETGGAVVGKTIKFDCDIELINNDNNK
ncbi:MAG TPA: YceI family protein [Bacteroidia bacterium]|nr:YceI family protein [Bacteroidia bacterium]